MGEIITKRKLNLGGWPGACWDRTRNVHCMSLHHQHPRACADASFTKVACARARMQQAIAQCTKRSTGTGFEA
jgi:hypothetical protein